MIHWYIDDEIKQAVCNGPAIPFDRSRELRRPRNAGNGESFHGVVVVVDAVAGGELEGSPGKVGGPWAKGKGNEEKKPGGMVEGSGRVGFVSPGIPGSPGSPGRDGACKRRRASTVFLVAPLIPESDSAVKKRKANSFGLAMLSLWSAGYLCDGETLKLLRGECMGILVMFIYRKDHWVLLFWLACRPYRSWFLNAAMVVRLAVNQPPGPSNGRLCQTRYKLLH